MFPENLFDFNKYNLLSVTVDIVSFLQDKCSNSDKSFIALEIQSKLDHGLLESHPLEDNYVWKEFASHTFPDMYENNSEN